MTKGTFHFDTAFRAPVGNFIESIEEEKRCHLCRRHLAFAIRARPRCWNWGKHDASFRPTLLRCEDAETEIGSVMSFGLARSPCGSDSIAKIVRLLCPRVERMLYPLSTLGNDEADN